jgi:hypothetical protein
MDVKELDQALGRLRANADRAGANLFELDRSPTRAVLAAALLEGQSARRWAEAEQALADLFQSYASLCATVDAAMEARGAGPIPSGARRAEVAHLVLGPSVEIPERAVPLAERDLLSVSRTLERCTPDELLASMGARFEVARAVIVATAEAWELGVPLVQALRERLVAVVEAGGLDPVADEVGMLDERLREVAEVLVSDPLAFDTVAVESLGEQVEALASAAEGARRARVEFDGDMAAAGVALASLRESTEAARRAEGDAQVRVVGLTPLPLVPLEALGLDLAHIGALGARGDWRAVATELGEWHGRVEQNRRDLDQAAARQREALQRRRRLRGRLDAYVAKAAHLGCIEQPALEQLRSDAETLLFSAPTDLERAEDAVQRYQHALDVAVDERSGRSR